MLHLIQTAQAQGINAGMLAVQPVTTNLSPGQLIVNVLLWFFTFVGGIAVIYLIYGGLLYITAGGDSEKATKGRTAVTNAVIGLIIIGLSFVILVWVNSALNAAAGGAATTNSNTNTNQAPNFNNPNFQSWLNSQGQTPANMTQTELNQAYQSWLNSMGLGGTTNQNGGTNQNSNQTDNGGSFWQNIFGGSNNKTNNDSSNFPNSSGYNTDDFGYGYYGDSTNGTLEPVKDAWCDPYDTGYQYSNCNPPSSSTGNTDNEPAAPSVIPF